MRVPCIELFASPQTPEMFGAIRSGLEESINRHHRHPETLVGPVLATTGLMGHTLASLQDAFNAAIRRDAVDVAPLCRRIQTGKVIA